MDVARVGFHSRSRLTDPWLLVTNLNTFMEFGFDSRDTLRRWWELSACQ